MASRRERGGEAIIERVAMGSTTPAGGYFGASGVTVPDTCAPPPLLSCTALSPRDIRTPPTCSSPNAPLPAMTERDTTISHRPFRR